MSPVPGRPETSQSAAPRAALGFPIRMGLAYATIFTVMGLHLPYLPVWLDARGLTAAEIGIVGALPLILRLVASPAAAIFADRLQSPGRVVSTLVVTALLAALSLTVTRDLWTIALAVTVFAVCLHSALPLVETIAMRGTRQLGAHYGRMRLWGSVTFIAANVLGGIALARLGIELLVPLLSVSLVATVLATRLPDLRHDDQRAPATGRASSTSPASTPRYAVSGLLRALVAEGAAVRFALVVAASALIQASHASYYAFSAIHWRSQGIPGDLVGVLWALGVIAEIALFAVSAAAIKRIGAVRLILIGALAGVVRWSVMALDPALPLLALLQLLHALSYGATHLGALHLVQDIAPDRYAVTAQALASTANSAIAMGAAMLLAGALYGPFGGTSFLAMAVLSAAGGLAALALRTRSH